MLAQLRRDVAKRSVLHTRRLAEGLEVLGENAASYGSAIIANDESVILLSKPSTLIIAIDDAVILYQNQHLQYETRTPKP